MGTYKQLLNLAQLRRFALHQMGPMKWKESAI